MSPFISYSAELASAYVRLHHHRASLTSRQSGLFDYVEKVHELSRLECAASHALNLLPIVRDAVKEAKRLLESLEAREAAERKVRHRRFAERLSPGHEEGALAR